jgi:phage tail-like protein
MVSLPNAPSWLVSDEYQPSAFYFKVVFPAASGITDTSFKEVSGISKEIITEDIEEGGENGFVYKLPKGVKHEKLILKRGIASMNSPLFVWCKSIIDGEFNVPFCCFSIIVYLMDEQKLPIRAWEFTNAFPVKWSVDNFESMKNEVAIETIEFEYQNSSRII